MEREGHQFETDVERDEIVTASQKHHADRGEENERVVLAVLFAFDVEITRRNTNRQRCRDQKYRFEQKREPVDSYHAVETVERQRRAHGPPLQAERDERQRDADE